MLFAKVRSLNHPADSIIIPEVIQGGHNLGAGEIMYLDPEYDERMAEPPLDQMRRNARLERIDAESTLQALRHRRRSTDASGSHHRLHMPRSRGPAPIPEYFVRKAWIMLRKAPPESPATHR